LLFFAILTFFTRLCINIATHQQNTSHTRISTKICLVVYKSSEKLYDIAQTPIKRGGKEC
ncbi:MAG TPA: hypothetical protein DCG57_16135, partial [Candidatus Riflebacteria bacterium]|nr:hypothetical protein [Candidatus Riflebacteria bacterium]